MTDTRKAIEVFENGRMEKCTTGWQKYSWLPEDLKTIRAAIQPQIPEWQPIETAPKDTK